MKFNTALLILFFVSLTAYAQLIDELPKDESGKLNFNEVVTVEKVSKEELFLRAKQFFAETFKNSKEVIQMEDKEAGIILGKIYGDIYIGSGIAITKEQMWFNLKIQVKDGRYKYEIYDIYYRTYAERLTTSKLYQSDEFFDKSVYFKENGKPKPIAEKHKEQTVSKANAVAGVIKEAMKKVVTSSDTAKTDW